MPVATKRRRQGSSVDDQCEAAKLSKKEEELAKRGGEAAAKAEVEEGEDTTVDTEAEMRRLLGFGSFGSTQGKSVEDNQTGPSRGHAKINTKREYRQVLNRNPQLNKRS